MICIVIKGPSISEVKSQLERAKKIADLVELRFDLFDVFKLQDIQTLLTDYPLPTIFKAPTEKIQELATLQPTYFDLNWDLPHDLLKDIPSIQIIRSIHDFDSTPDNLEAVYNQLKQAPHTYCKLATRANSTLDALRMIDFVQKSSEPILGLCMGDLGQITRILAPVIGAPWTYACLDENNVTADGQLLAKALLNRYHYRSLNRETALYGLIGDPVSSSISDFTHNQVMQSHHLNTVYIKMQIPPSELPVFFPLARSIGFQGLSVTMPLKEKVGQFLDEVDPNAQSIGAVNTIVSKGKQWTGYNTDGVGALDAIEAYQLIREKDLLIIGAGGASKAIAYEAVKRKANVTLLNRDASKAKQLAKSLGCKSGSLDQIHDHHPDIVINTTPHPLPFDPSNLTSNMIVMDIKTRPKLTELLERAKEKKCHLVYGYRMFVNQAVEQYRLWFQEIKGSNRLKEDLTTYSEETLNN